MERDMQDLQPQNFIRTVDLENPAQVERLCAKFQCSEIELHEAVRMVGPTQIWVEQWIRWMKMN
jgi:hypothetical protein